VRKFLVVGTLALVATLFAGCGPMEATWEPNDEVQFLGLCQQTMRSFKNVSTQQAVSFCRCHLKELKADGYTIDDVANKRTPKSLMSKCEEYAGIS